MKPLRVAFGLVVAVSLAACASSGSGGTVEPSGGTTAPPGGTTAPPGTSTSTSAPATTTTTSATGGTTAEPSDQLTGPYVLIFKQSGGIAALRMETVLDSAGKTMTYGGMRNQTPETRALSDQEVGAITALINAAGLAMLDGKLKGVAPADAFSYEIDIKTAEKDRALTWSDGAKVPQRLLDLQLGIVKLRDEKFRGGTPKGAPTM